MAEPREVDRPTVEFIDGDLPLPPRSSEVKAGVDALIDVLREQPNRWAKVNSYPDDPAKAHRRREAILKHGAEELEVRVQIPDVWARYVGDEEGEEDDE